jgi:hypothetical protein
MREGDYGWIERTAFLSFVLGMAGTALAVLAWKTFDESSLVGWVLSIWFAPLIICVLCWWAVFAKDEFGGLCQTILVLCGLGIFTGDPESLLGIPILIAISWAMRFLHKPARAILNLGRSQYRKL